MPRRMQRVRMWYQTDPWINILRLQATHIVQQQAGVQLKDNIGTIGDPYERQAGLNANGGRSIGGRYFGDKRNGWRFE